MCEPAHVRVRVCVRVCECCVRLCVCVWGVHVRMRVYMSACVYCMSVWVCAHVCMCLEENVCMFECVYV